MFFGFSKAEQNLKEKLVEAFRTLEADGERHTGNVTQEESM